MRWAGGLLLFFLLVGCGMEPSNTDLGLRVEALVQPRVLSLSDSAAELRISVLVTNPGEHDIIVTTGGPPYSITTDPAESRGLTLSFRIASRDEPLIAGPTLDAWGEPADTIRSGHGEYLGHSVKLSDWQKGWTVLPGEYRVRSYYNGQEGESAPFLLTP